MLAVRYSVVSEDVTGDMLFLAYFRWGRRELSITLGMCTMPKAKVSVGAGLSLEISQKRS